jgi:ABC-type uncharacterized transport system permease subunit
MQLQKVIQYFVKIGYIFYVLIFACHPWLYIILYYIHFSFERPEIDTFFVKYYNQAILIATEIWLHHCLDTLLIALIIAHLVSQSWHLEDRKVAETHDVCSYFAHLPKPWNACP